MPIIANGMSVQNVTYNGISLKKVIYDGVIVFYKGEKIVAIYFCGNWKMNQTKASIDTFFETFNTAVTPNVAKQVVIFPPAIYLQYCQSKLSESLSDTVKFGVQLVANEASGAYTGQISAQMVADMGASYAIVGQSECRTYLGITNDDCQKQMLQCSNFGITPVLCIGENLTEYEAGETATVLSEQLTTAMTGWSGTNTNLVIAYEPVWAIGTGKTITAQQYQDRVNIIRDKLSEIQSAEFMEKIPIIFGGASNNPTAAHNFIKAPLGDGLLSDGVSLRAANWAAIINEDY